MPMPHRYFARTPTCTQIRPTRYPTLGIEDVIPRGWTGWAHSTRVGPCAPQYLLWSSVQMVGVEKHSIAEPSTHESNCVDFDSCKNKCQEASWLHWARTDLGGFETDSWACDIDCLLNHLGDLSAYNCRQFYVFGYFCQWHAAAGSI